MQTFPNDISRFVYKGQGGENLILQKRALWLMFFAKPTLTFLCFERLSLLMHDVYHQVVPSNMRSMFMHQTNIRLRDALIWNGLPIVNLLSRWRNLNLNRKSNKFSRRFFRKQKILTFPKYFVILRVVVRENRAKC